MAEDGPRDLSGPKPVDEDKPRPTVIKARVGKARPSTVKSDKAGQTDKPPVRPTLVDTAAVRKAKNSLLSSQRHPAAAKPVAAKPTAIPGVERKRIALDLADIKKLSPRTKPGVPERALRLIETFVLEGVGDRQAVLWGHRLQQDYSDLVSRTLELSQADVLRKVTGYIGRMNDILGAINIEAVCGVAPASGMIGEYFKKLNSKIDTPQELEAARIELEQLVRLMGECLEQLLSFKEMLEQQSNRIEDMGNEVEASAIAAEFLSAHLRERNKALSQRFLERSMSLMQTAVQIRGSTSMREVQIEQPLRLIAAIQNVALVMVPGWLGSIAALSTVLASKRKLTSTEAGELAYQLRDLLQQLNP